MDTQNRDTNGPALTGSITSPTAIDPRWRVYVPIEKRNLDGTKSFRTTDGDRYLRVSSGAIRKLTPKTARSKKERRKLRHADARS